jgi:hypothetical protein
LKRRYEKLLGTLESGENVNNAIHGLELLDDLDELTAEETETLEDRLTDRSTAATNTVELRSEIDLLAKLVDQAAEVRASGQDRKWQELARLLNGPEIVDSTGIQRKLIIFSEHRDTLKYLQRRIQEIIPAEGAVVQIHGGTGREERRDIAEAFRHDPAVRILIATDAAGEGINLQTAHLMVNYDLPWNPNRLEQRFGRIHRIGQTEVCHLWNLVADNTREGYVFDKLFDKIRLQSEAFGGEIFDILGEVFHDKSLREMLIEAIRYNNDPVVRARLSERIDNAMETEALRKVISRNALCTEVQDPSTVFRIKKEMDLAEARRLQPHFIKTFFSESFARLGGELQPREPGRFSISNVPASIREFSLTAKPGERTAPVLKRYDRVCFDKNDIRLKNGAGTPAALLYPGHPLMDAVRKITYENTVGALQRGAVLFDENDWSTAPSMLFAVQHDIVESTDQGKVVSQRLQFVSVNEDGRASSAGWAPHLDMTSLNSDDASFAEAAASAVRPDELEECAMEYAIDSLIPEHVREVKGSRLLHVDRTLTAVNERMGAEIKHWKTRVLALSAQALSGKDVRLTLDNITKQIAELEARLATRVRELEAMRSIDSKVPLIVAKALVMPRGYLAQRRGDHAALADAAARKRIEMIAMAAVANREKALAKTAGIARHVLEDVSKENCGWDITSTWLNPDGSILNEKHIEVKGRKSDAATVCVSRNELLSGLNQGEKFFLAIVLVDAEGTVVNEHYIRRPFYKEPEFAVSSINYSVEDLLEMAESRQDISARQLRGSPSGLPP